MDAQLQNILMQQAIVIHQETEITNLLVGIDSPNRYSIHGADGNQIGHSVEVSGGVGGFLQRQLFQNSRACDVKLFGMNGMEIAELKKPFKFFFAEISANIAGQEIGRAKRTTAFNRNYSISVGGIDTFSITSSLFQWKNFKFEVFKNGVHVATIMKRYEGALKMIFTQADTFTIEFYDQSLTLEERYTLLATTYLIDYDCFEQN